MKKILAKDLLREIYHSFMRFLSIVILVALGTAFFIGLKSAAPDMLAAGNTYFRTHHFNDLTVVSNEPVSAEQAEKLHALPQIANVSLGHKYYVISKPNDLAVELTSLNKETYELVEGRFPKKKHEILMDATSRKNFSVGDTISFSSNDNEQIDQLTVEKFTIVGFAYHYRFLSKADRGISPVGDGTLDAFAAVLPEALSENTANVFNITLKQSLHSLDLYSHAYQAKVEHTETSVAKLMDNLQFNRKNVLLADIQQSEDALHDQKQELIDGIAHLSDEINTLEATIASYQQLAIVDETSKQADITLGTLKNEKKQLQETLDNVPDQEQNIADAKKAVDNLAYEIIPIYQTLSFSGFKENIERLDALGNSIPFLFYFIASLVTVTIITRMIEQERKQIGTLKALGVNNRLIMRKYSYYCIVSGLSGLIVGIFGGIYLFPKLLISLYSPMYIVTDYPLLIYWKLVSISIVVCVLSVIMIPYLFYKKTLNQPALHLLRPKMPTSGQRIILEYVPFIWNLLSFQLKMSLRNMFRYKYRMGLMFIGILGCMTLLVTGFGARNSVSQLQEYQFRKIQNYQMEVALNSDAEAEELEKYQHFMANRKKTEHYGIFRDKWETALPNNKTTSVNIIMPMDDEKKLGEFITLIDAADNKTMEMTRNSVFVSKKLAQLLAVQPGDTLILKNSDGQSLPVEITAIVENYYEHYLYIGANAYKKHLAIPSHANSELVKYDTMSSQEKKELLKFAAVGTLATREQAIEKMDGVTEQLDSLIIAVTIASGILGLVVIYNLSYVNILERTQELAVIYVMGYRPKKMTRHIFRELLILGIIAVTCGWQTGFLTHQMVMAQIELEFLSFPHVEKAKVFLLAAGTLVSISIILVTTMHHKIKKMDVVSSLKDRE